MDYSNVTVNTFKCHKIVIFDLDLDLYLNFIFIKESWEKKKSRFPQKYVSIQTSLFNIVQGHIILQK